MKKLVGIGILAVMLAFGATLAEAAEPSADAKRQICNAKVRKQYGVDKPNTPRSAYPRNYIQVVDECVASGGWRATSR